MFSENLASYFPSQDVPNYSDYERQYPKYRKELEERYPQVCEECEPRVRERIRATGYAAKTDHLRRLMERTRGGIIPRGESGWKILLVSIGGMAWGLSLVGQLAWDGLSLLSLEQDNGGLIDEDASVSSLGCLRQAVRESAVSPDCTTLADSWARFALLLGVLSFWWNPRLRERLVRFGGRFYGLQEYYKLQAISLFARFLAWTYVAGLSSSESGLQRTKGIHAAIPFFGALVSRSKLSSSSSLIYYQLTIMSFRAVGLDYSPRVVFQDSPEPLISTKSQPMSNGIASERSRNILHQTGAHPAQRRSNVQPFSINDFAPASGRQHPNPYQSPHQPLTPPPDEDDDGAMDWTPSQQGNFRPATLHRPSPSNLQPTQPTPFRGHLPANVVSMEHRLRNPPNKPTFRKASESTKQSFFQTPKTISHRGFDNMSDTATEYEPSNTEDTPVAATFADPKFRFQSAESGDTGLERLLANSFSLDDEPQEVRVLKRQKESGTRSSNNDSLTLWLRLPMFILLMMSCLSWTKVLKISSSAYQTQLRLATLLLTAITSTRSLILALRKDFNNRIGSDLIIFTSELLASIFLVFTTGPFSTSSFVIANQESIDFLGATLIGIMALQGLWTLFFDLRALLGSSLASPSDSATTTELAAAESPPSQHLPRINEASQIATLPSSRMLQSSNKPAQRSTRSKTKETRSALTNHGFSSLSLSGNQNSPVSGQLDGMGSLSLRTPRTSNRRGI